MKQFYLFLCAITVIILLLVIIGCNVGFVIYLNSIVIDLLWKSVVYLVLLLIDLLTLCWIIRTTNDVE